MTMKRVITYAAVFTLIGIGYVHLQVEIISMGYRLRDKEKRLSEMIDRNRVLLYNNTCLKSPQYLANKLQENDLDLAVPDTEAVSEMRIVRSKEHQYARSLPAEPQQSFLDKLVPKAQAALQSRK